jgi:phage FluMu gp28-like protein
MTSKTPKLYLDVLRPDQWEIVKHPAKFKVIAAGRRYGKSTTCGNAAILDAVNGRRVAWITPTYKNARPFWVMVERAIRELVASKQARIDRKENQFTFSSGGSISLFSADNPQSILGNNFHFIIIDEAARIDENVYYETLKPMVADTDGDIWMISTPKGLNWFYTEYLRGLRDMKELGDSAEVAAFHRRTRDNPNPNILKAYERVKREIPSVKFRQEWDAEFITEGVLFSNVDANIYGEMPTTLPKQNRNDMWVMGVDLGKLHDPTVAVVYDVNEGRVVWIESYHSNYTEQIQRLKTLVDHIQPAAMVVERTGNQGVIEMLQNANLPITPFDTTNASKTRIIDNLIMKFERGEISIPNHQELIGELLMFEATQGKGSAGIVRYSAPRGQHDDHVIALALAVEAAHTGVTWEAIIT